MIKMASRIALLGLALGTVAFAPVVLAQDSAPAEGSSGMQHRAAPDPQKQADRLAKRLGLSADQTSKITAILQNRQQQAAALRSDSSLDRDDRRAKMRSIQESTQAQINAVLTPAQQAEYAKMQQEMHDRQGQREHGGGDAPAGDDSH